MNKLTLAFLIAAFLLVLPVQATIYVGGDEGVTSISEAIALAKENETIIVYEGIYHENVVIDKPLVLKTSGNVTIEARDDSASVVWIKAHNVVFSSFHVKRGYNGISLNNVQSGKIENNSVFENDFGIALISSCNNIIANNTAFNNKVNGIHLQDYSDTNKITNNTACENGNRGLEIQDSEENIVTHNSLSMNLDGIFLLRANKNELRNNTACENSNVGLQIQDSEENIVTHNSLSMNLDGIFLLRANKNELRNNTACENSNVGLQIQDSEENIVTHNSLSMNLHGIVLMLGANKNELRNNTACENSDAGLKIQDSEENIVTHNSLSKNSDGIVLALGANKNELRNNIACENSDVGLQIQDSEENIVTHNSLSKNLNGIVLLLGANKNELRNNNVVDSKNNQAHVENSALNKFNYNYWSDYEAQYPDAQEKSNTGIGDIPYEIKGYEQVDYDDYPYMNYSGWLNVVITPEYWEFYTKKGDIQYFYNNFSIENRLNSPTEVEILLEQNLEFVTDK